MEEKYQNLVIKASVFILSFLWIIKKRLYNFNVKIGNKRQEIIIFNIVILLSVKHNALQKLNSLYKSYLGKTYDR